MLHVCGIQHSWFNDWWNREMQPRHLRQRQLLVVGQTLQHRHHELHCPDTKCRQCIGDMVADNCTVLGVKLCCICEHIFLYEHCAIK